MVLFNAIDEVADLIEDTRQIRGLELSDDVYCLANDLLEFWTVQLLRRSDSIAGVV